MVWGQFPDAWSAHALSNGQIYRDGREHFGPGLRNGNHHVRNVFAYDATGKPLTGVQLYDEQGRPLGVTEDRYYGSYRLVDSRVQTYPWLNGVRPLWNVFPLPVREQRGDRRPQDAWTSTNPPAVPTAPLAVAPPASLPTARVTPQAAGPTPSGSRSAGPSVGRFGEIRAALIVWDGCPSESPGRSQRRATAADRECPGEQAPARRATT
jgi:hypothetical protein